jgi:hypothetical protein
MLWSVQFTYYSDWLNHPSLLIGLAIGSTCLVCQVVQFTKLDVWSSLVSTLLGSDNLGTSVGLVPLAAWLGRSFWPSGWSNSTDDLVSQVKLVLRLVPPSWPSS